MYWNSNNQCAVEKWKWIMKICWFKIFEIEFRLMKMCRFDALHALPFRLVGCVFILFCWLKIQIISLEELFGRIVERTRIRLGDDILRATMEIFYNTNMKDGDELDLICRKLRWCFVVQKTIGFDFILSLTFHYVSEHDLKMFFVLELCWFVGFDHIIWVIQEKLYWFIQLHCAL